MLLRGEGRFSRTEGRVLKKRGVLKKVCLGRETRVWEAQEGGWLLKKGGRPVPVRRS